MSESSLEAGDTVVYSSAASEIVQGMLGSSGPFVLTDVQDEPCIGRQVTLRDIPSGKEICGPNKRPRFVSAGYFKKLNK